MRLFQSMTYWTPPQKQRSQASTGARISTSKFSPASPKGGFGSNVYEGARYLDETYGRRTESYYRQRLFGNNADDFRWRYDLNKHLIGRDYHKSGNASFPWLPRFPKQKYTSPSPKFLQESTKVRPSEFRSGFQQYVSNPRFRWNNSKTNIKYRRTGTNRCRCKVYRSTVCCKQCGFNPSIRQLYSAIQRQYASNARPRYYRW